MTETLPMLTPQDVARILGVHQKTVHLWLRNGKLKGIKISYRAWRIPRSALEQFIEALGRESQVASLANPSQDGADRLSVLSFQEQDVFLQKVLVQRLGKSLPSLFQTPDLLVQYLCFPLDRKNSRFHPFPKELPT